jgi:phosphatidylinositol alpha-1,6-mannosyltransferase
MDGALPKPPVVGSLMSPTPPTTVRPRVVFFAATLQPGHGGIAQVARMTARVLARLVREARIEAQAVTLLDAEPPEDIQLPVTPCNGSRLRFVTNSFLAARTHTHFIYEQLGLSRARPLLPGLRRPTLGFLYGVEIWEATRQRAQLACRAEALVTISEHTRKKAMARHAELARARVCWLATESDEPASRPTGDTPRVLMVSRVDEPYKGHDLLVDCWPQVKAAVPDARLSFVGKGRRLAELRGRAAASPAHDAIEVRGFVDPAELDALYARSTVFAMPSRGEGFGLVYVEAMRHALPVIATVHDAGNEINAHGETGYNVDLDRKDELPARLIELLSCPEKATTFGERAQKRWAEFFRYSGFELRLMTLLDEFLRTGCLV